MKKLSNIALILGLLFFVGSMTSCSATRRSGAAKKKKRKKNCDCPKWTDVDKKIPEDEIVAFEDVL